MRARKQKQRKSQSGFTLIEVMISLVLLAVGVLALSAAQVVFFKSTTLTQTAYQANGLADQVFEIVLRNPTLITGGGSTSITVGSGCGSTGEGVQAQICRALNNAEQKHMSNTEVTLQQVDAANSVWEVAVEWQSGGEHHLVAKDMGL